jgi:hypothetical protein
MCVGLIAAVATALPFYRRGWIARRQLLHPPVRRYRVSVKQAFARVRQVLSESTYGYGDKWHVSSADTVQKRITACLRFTEGEVSLQGTSLFQVYVRKDRKHRLLELTVQMQEEPGDVTAIQFDFQMKVEGLALYACDRAIQLVLSDIEKMMVKEESPIGA